MTNISRITNERSEGQLTLVINLCTFCKEVLGASVNTVSMEVVGLEELGPELSLWHLCRHILQVLLSYCRVCLKYRLDYVCCQVVLQSVAAISLWLDVGLGKMPM